MSMTARERAMAVIFGTKPDKIPIYAFEGLRIGPPGGWVRRLVKRGLGLIRTVSLHVPRFVYPPPSDLNYYLKDIYFSQTHYQENGLRKCRYTFETPVGNVTGVIAKNPGNLLEGATEEPLVKAASDWGVINFICRAILDSMKPDYETFEMMEDTLGGMGMTFALIGKTPFQKAWVELASLERAVFDYADRPDEFIEYLEIQKRMHERGAEILADGPAKCAIIFDHITDTISPTLFQETCTSFYEIYSKVAEEVGVVLGCHMDGRLGHLKEEIAKAPIRVVDSFTVPPVGQVSLTEAKLLWPGKALFINCPPHLHFAEPDDVRDGYSVILEEWGDRDLLFEHSEDMPIDRVEMHLSSAMDVLGY